MNQTLQEYCLQLGEVLCMHNGKFRKVHPDFETADLLMLGSLTINGEAHLGSFHNFESLRGMADFDLVATQRAVELCKKFVEANREV